MTVIAAKHLSWNYHPVMLSKPRASMMRAPWWKRSLGLLWKPKPCHLTCHAWPNTKHGVTSASTLSKGWQKEKDCVKVLDLQSQNCKQTREVNDVTYLIILVCLDSPSKSIKGSAKCKYLSLVVLHSGLVRQRNIIIQSLINRHSFF